MAIITDVLTDVVGGVWHDVYTRTAADGIILSGSADWSLSKRTLRGGLSEGVDVIDVNNGALSISVLPTRGMGLWRGAYRGTPLGWNSPVGMPVNPNFINLEERGGLGWLAGLQ